MKKFTAFLLMMAIATVCYAQDPTWISDNAILNRSFDSDENALMVNVSGGTVKSADITAHRVQIYDDTALEDYISMDVYGGHLEIQPTSLSAIKINSGMNDTDTVIGGATNPQVIAVDASTGRVGIGTRTPTVSLDVVGVIKAPTITADTNIVVGTTTVLSTPANGVDINENLTNAPELALTEWSDSGVQPEPAFFLRKSHNDVIGTLTETITLRPNLGKVVAQGVGSGGAFANAATIAFRQIDDAGATNIPGKVIITTHTAGGPNAAQLVISSDAMVYVSDIVRLGPVGTSPDVTIVPATGGLYYNSSAGTLDFYDGTSWNEVLLGATVAP